ncbi:MAG: choice-of-anchor B family protein [Bacteroidetes bacterium]|nr:choice-of-anchor B family protein [Bacteroidota bacterium]
MKQLFTRLIILLIPFGLQAQSSLNMNLVGSWDDDDLPAAFYGSFNEVWGYTDCDGNEYAILGSSGYIHFFDLADPTQPEEIARFEGGDVTVWRDIKTYEDHVYTVCDGCGEGMMIFDLSNLPDEVVKVDQTNAFFDNSHNIFIDEDHGRLYAVGTNTSSFGMVVLDVAGNPDAPEELATVGLPGGYIHDLYVRDNIVYANSANNGLYVYDFSDPEDPQIVGTMTDYEEQGYNHSGWLTDDGNTLVMLDETHGTGVKLVDVSNPDAINVIDIFRSTLLAPDFTNSVGHNPYVRGDLAFISYYHDGVQVYDISDPEDVQNIAYYDTDETHADYSSYTGNWGLYPFLPSGLILASDMNAGLHVLSIEGVSLQETTPATYPDVDLAFFDTTACLGQSIELLTVGSAESYEWMVFDAIIPDSDSPGWVVTESGNYSVLASNDHCAILTDEVMVTFAEAPTPTISYDSGTLSSTVAESYQWYLDGIEIPGATEQTFVPTDEGTYSVLVTDESGCVAFSDELVVMFNSLSDLDKGVLRLSPNPASDWLELSWQGESLRLEYQLCDMTGRVLETGIWNTSNRKLVPTSSLASGMYLIRLTNQSGQTLKKFVVQ